MTRIILDPGSTHDGSLGKAEELVHIAKKSGADAIKFQLLTKKQLQGGNIMLPWEWLPALIDVGEELGVEVFASVFNTVGIDYLASCGCESIKFAHSQRELYYKNDLREFKNRYVSSNDMKLIKDCINLWCIPEYPVPYIPNFGGLFDKYNGFSSHCMGISQDFKAVLMGAEILEFHIKGSWESKCPDAFFAKSPDQTESLIQQIRGIE